MEGYLRTTDNADVASTCPLLTPSPPTNALVNPLPELTEPDFNIGDLAIKLQNVQQENTESTSSSSSVLAEPSCTQLLNSHSNYHRVIKDDNVAAHDSNGTDQPVQLTFRSPPENFFFMNWNWNLIRKISMWLFMSVLIGMVALVIAMIVSLPTKCNPVTQWYQGNVFYEIFPARFHSSNSDGHGDFIGISRKVNYFKKLGVRAIRLNSIFATNNYPEDYKNVTILTQIAAQLGTKADFVDLLEVLHTHNLSLILDLEIPVTLQTFPNFEPAGKNRTSDAITEALTMWINCGVDGFYIKGLERFVNDSNFYNYVRLWKSVIGPDRPLIIHQDVLKNTPEKNKNTLLNNVDLIDVLLNIGEGAAKLSRQIDSFLNSTLFTKVGAPWIHWTLGGEYTTSRLVNRVPISNATLGATLFELTLPGTPSIFYGDEVGLPQITDQKTENLQRMSQFNYMVWPDDDQNSLHFSVPVSLFDQVDVISKMIFLRKDSPAIYVNSVTKDGDKKATAEVKYSQKDLLVIQRWFPRRKSYVVISNLGTFKISADLSSLLYSGHVAVAPKLNDVSESITFSNINLWPGESVVVILD